MPSSFKETEYKEYKFKNLKIYGSTEWLTNNRKKYRQVFNEQETGYIYVELSFYNKMFDEKTWDVNIQFICYSLKGKKKKLCDLKFDKKVSKHDNVFYVREGWGNKKDGSFWKSGTYYWEAKINGDIVATKYFYIEDSGSGFEEKINPFFTIKSAKIHEGEFDEIEQGQLKNYTAFSIDDTRYIHTQLELYNLIPYRNWHCELFFNYYNEVHELKGRIVKLINVKKNTKIITENGGWGSNSPGTWRKGKYSVEIVFLDRIVAILNFDIKEEFEEGEIIPELRYQYEKTPEILVNPTESFEEVLLKLDNLVGLHDIKQKVKAHSQYLEFLKLRKIKGFDEKDSINIHSVFIGNPGTGKTTVAKMMGALYHKMGILSKGHVHEVDRASLVGEYIGQTAPKVKKAIAKAKGGVLFIDEAYALARNNDDAKDFGREVIEILVKEMSSIKADFAVIVAGYPKEMKSFISSNPGLRSRFKHFFEFKDYLPQELIEISKYAAKEKQVDFTADAQILLEELITDEYRKRDKAFGNARYIHDLIDKSKMNLGLRTMNRKNPNALSSIDLMTITAKDMKRLSETISDVKADIPVDTKLLKMALEELNELIGIISIKKQIGELVDIVNFHRSSGRSVMNNYSFHSVFVGNPGTGKTTVARILTKIYKALGILERGHMVETDRQGLVAGFIGQTATKTVERIEEAMGGVLFIDEAYALNNSNSSGGDYGNEAIQTILKRMEDNRGKFYVFAAGYPGNMERFLKTNPGLASRFDKTFHFEDYSAEELGRISIKMIADNNMRITKKAAKLLGDRLTELYKYRDKYFGNARTVRKLIIDLIKYQNHRIALQPIDKRSKQSENLIINDDVLKLNILEDQKGFEQQGIGF
ncbi:MAG: AAA family ATPase [Saprospiraceae bacterium]